MVEEILRSKTIWWIAWLIAMLAPRLFWVEITQTEIMEYIEPIAVGVFWILALYWRLVAKWPILNKTDWTESVIQELFEDDDDSLYGWAIDWVSETDWIMWEVVDPNELPKLTRNFDTAKIQYNQGKWWSNNWCTVFAAMWAVSDLTWIVWSEAQMKDVYNTAVKEWLDPKVWWFTHKAVDLVRKKAKELLGLEINYATFEMSDAKLLNSLADKWYSVVGWFKWNSNYNKDKNEDWIVTNIHKPTTYWHAIRRFWKRIIDNYFWIKWNVYTNDLVQEMLKAWTLHTWWFVYFKVWEDKLEQWKEKVKANIEDKKKTNDYMFVKKSDKEIRLPYRVPKNSPKRIENWKKFVKFEWERVEYRK